MSHNTGTISGIDTITLNDTISLDGMSSSTYNYPSSYPYTISVTGNTGPLLTGSNGISDTIIFSDDLSGSTLSVRGDADISGDLRIQGVSLNDRLDKIEERLGILRVNDALEEKWENLRELANQYRALEKEIIEKEKMWDILKK